MTPLEKLAKRHALAEIALLEEKMAYQHAMRTAAAEAHAAGITRYMAQKATGAPQSEVAAWFGDLPTSKPGRRRKDDPIYGGVA